MAGENKVVIDLSSEFKSNFNTEIKSAIMSIDKFNKMIENEKRQIDCLNHTKGQVILEVKDHASSTIRDVTDRTRKLSGRVFSFTVKAVDLATKQLLDILNLTKSLKSVTIGIGVNGRAVSDQRKNNGDKDTGGKSGEFIESTPFKVATEGSKAIKDAKEGVESSAKFGETRLGKYMLDKSLLSEKSLETSENVAKVVSGEAGVGSEVLSAGLKGVSKAAIVLGLADSAYNVATSKDKAKAVVHEAGSWGGAIAGAKLGGMAGMAIGSLIPVPFAGTAIGGGVGAVAGGVLGAMGGEKIADSLYDARGAIGKWAASTGKSIGNFFTGTLPGETGIAVSSIGAFATNTIPNALGKTGNAVGKFFTDLPYNTGREIGCAAGNVQKFAVRTVPEFAGAVGGFFAKATGAAASALGSAAGAAHKLVTRTIPGAAGMMAGAVGGFITKTVPDAAAKLSANAKSFVTKTIPGAAGMVAGAVGGFITKTVPDAAAKLSANAKSFVTKTIPGAAGMMAGAVGGFITKTVPDAAAKLSASAKDFVTKTIPGAVGSIGGIVSEFFTKTIPAATLSAFSSIGKWFQGGWNSFTRGIRDGYSETSAHASGGLFNHPHLGLVAEDGPEAIIPLSTKRRSNGLSLWKEAGRLMGVEQYASGGIVGNVTPLHSKSSTGGNSGDGTVQVSLAGNSFHFHISGADSAKDIVDQIESHADEIVNIISLKLAPKLEKAFVNRTA